MKIIRDEKTQAVTLVQFTGEQIRAVIERYLKNRQLTAAPGWELEILVGGDAIPISRRTDERVNEAAR